MILSLNAPLSERYKHSPHSVTAGELQDALDDLDAYRTIADTPEAFGEAIKVLGAIRANLSTTLDLIDDLENN